MPPVSQPAEEIAKKSPAPNYDTPWKIAVEQHFRAFIAFYFPKVHDQIDWTFQYEFMDKELQAIAKDALVGTRHVDKLVKVRHVSGKEEWLYIHLEIQMSRQTNFAKRMFVYNYRIFDRYDQPVVSIAVLGDEDHKWLPTQFGYSAMGCGMSFHFPVVKLAHYAAEEADLESNPNPFALLTLAYLKNRATRTNMPVRYEVKCKLVRLLHAHHWDEALIRQFFLVIDWMMALPPELEAQLSNFIAELEEEQKMEYVSSIERVRLEQKLHEGIDLGKQESSSELLGRLLTLRFGSLSKLALERVKNASRDEITVWFDRAVNATTLDDVFQDLAH
jgi:hypothetical protein